MKEETGEETRDGDKETGRGRGRQMEDEGRQKEIGGREIEKDLGVGVEGETKGPFPTSLCSTQLRLAAD